MRPTPTPAVLTSCFMQPVHLSVGMFQHIYQNREMRTNRSNLVNKVFFKKKKKKTNSCLLGYLVFLNCLEHAEIYIWTGGLWYVIINGTLMWTAWRARSHSSLSEEHVPADPGSVSKRSSLWWGEWFIPWLILNHFVTFKFPCPLFFFPFLCGLGPKLRQGNHVSNSCSGF